MAKTQQYLALYTGPNGPISRVFTAPRFHGWPVGNPVATHIGHHEISWYNQGANDLDMDPDSATLEQDIEAALITGRWSLLHDAEDGPIRGVLPRMISEG